MGCYNQIEVSAPPKKVWNTIADFHDMSWASGVISSVEAVGDKKGNEVGAKRILNGVFHETLTEIDSDNLTFSYTIDDGPGPVAKEVVRHYVGGVKLSPSGTGTLVEWRSSFESPCEQEVVDFCDPIYQALLSALKEAVS